MVCCTPTVKRATAFGVSSLFLVIGLLIILLWNNLNDYVKRNELTITTNSIGFHMWKETPIPMYLYLYLFNWTNAAEVLKNWNIKPIFKECGPYVYQEHHSRVNLDWQANNTIFYQQNRTWFYRPDLSEGSLDDSITNLNVIASTIGHTVKDMNPIVRRMVSFFLNEKERSLVTTKPAREWIFEGIDDEMLRFLKKLNLSSFDIPFDKFGWFYARNGSASYDGNYTMYTGVNDMDLLGIIELWNGNSRTKYYSSYCGWVNGTSGELWPPVKKYDKVSIFSSDICSSISVFKSDASPQIEGINGKQYIGTDYMFDNGSKYPEMECFNGGRIFPSGVRDVSKCRFNAPAYVSHPHFYLADPYFRKGIIGMEPNPMKHNFTVVLEPLTGVPLSVNAQLQINLLLQPIPNILMFKNVKELFIPMLWFRQSATLTPEISERIKILLILPNVGTYTGYGCLLIGILLLLISLIVTFKRAWKIEDHMLLSQKSFES